MANEHPLRTVILSNAVTVLLSVSASYVALSGQDKTSDASVYQSTIERMNAQDLLISQLRISQTKSDLRIIELEAEVRRSGNHTSVLRAYINGLDTPAWIKRRDENGNYVMYITNEAYSEAYGKSRIVYEGQPDEAMWPTSVTENWHRNDDRAYHSGRTIRVNEFVLNMRGEKEEIEVWKFAVELPSGSQGVAGIVINNKGT